MRSLGLALIAVSGLAALKGQTTPTFEVASVKPSRPGVNGPSFRYLPGGRLSVTNCPLYTLIAEAYGLSSKSPRLTGGPDWAHDEKYDIDAAAAAGKIPPGLALRDRQAALRPMLQGLLADRFKLSIRPERKKTAIYALAVSKGGLKLQKTKSGSGQRETCHCLSGPPQRGLKGEAFQMSDLTALVEYWMGRPAIDKTGIQGEFDLPQTSAWSTVDQSPLPVFPDLLRSFGIVLESRKAQVDILTIRHVERPSAN